MDDERKLYLNTPFGDPVARKFVSDINIPSIVRKSFCLAQRIWDYRYHKVYERHYDELALLKDIHKGERCFIIGMGPSLDKTRFDLIKDEHFIASNNFYQGLDKFGIKPEYWVVADDAVFDIHAENLLRLDTTLFLTEAATRIFLKYRDLYMNGVNKEPIIVKPLGASTTWMDFSKDLRKGAYGGMVTISNLQVAFHLGFKDIHLLGCDCTALKGVHFGDATSFNLQGVVDNEWGSAFARYKVYKKLFEKEGRNIYNSTVGGELEIFERVSVEELV